MEKLIINGERRLSGTINIDAAKNSILPIIACCIMSKKEIIIKNAPQISDILSMINIIKSIGGSAKIEDSTITINCINANPKLVESNLTGSIRSSIFILGPILSRYKYADVSYPGGCEIGLRPIDLHIKGLKDLNVKIQETGGMIVCDGSEMCPSAVNLDFPSVGATENIMMAAVLTSGTTTICNAAREPEIIDLANFINFLGGKVSGAGTGMITIEGVESLGGGEYTCMGDRIVAGTYLCACAMCGGKVEINGIAPELLRSVLEKLKISGSTIIQKKQSIILKSSGKILPCNKLETQPYPGFPTDMQPQFTSLLTIADGASIIVENLFENRFKYTVQLAKMGANIVVKDRVAMVRGVKHLVGTNVTAEDLRGGAALVIAGLCANGSTVVSNIYHIDRGYYKIENSLKKLGADIKRVIEID